MSKYIARITVLKPDTVMYTWYGFSKAYNWLLPTPSEYFEVTEDVELNDIVANFKDNMTAFTAENCSDFYFDNIIFELYNKEERVAVAFSRNVEDAVVCTE